MSWTALKNNKFLSSLGWLGASEFVVRLTRLLTAIVLARTLDPVTFGTAALVLTINELVRVINQNGIGAKIVQCEEKELNEICNTAYRMNFILCFSLFVLQCLIAYPIAKFYNSPQIIPMLQVLAVVYLLMPFGMVQAALIKREQKMKVSAIIEGGQVAVDNIITAVFAVLGMGAWAIVLPKFITSPIWVFGYRYAYKWHPTGKLLQFNQWREILSFGRFYLASEILKTSRLNLDNLIIGRLLGMEVLGFYYFARNAGLGFSLSLTNAINAALYPNLCEVSDKLQRLKARFKQNLILTTAIIVPLIGLQAFLAPWYVPLVFGDKWTVAIPVLMFLCLSAIPRPFADSASALLISQNQIKTEFSWQLLFTTLFIITVTLASFFNLLTVAVSIFIIYMVTHPVFLIYTHRLIFKPLTKNISNQEVVYGAH